MVHQSGGEKRLALWLKVTLEKEEGTSRRELGGNYLLNGKEGEPRKTDFPSFWTRPATGPKNIERESFSEVERLRLSQKRG